MTPRAMRREGRVGDILVLPLPRLHFLQPPRRGVVQPVAPRLVAVAVGNEGAVAVKRGCRQRGPPAASPVASSMPTGRISAMRLVISMTVRACARLFVAGCLGRRLFERCPDFCKRSRRGRFFAIFSILKSLRARKSEQIACVSEFNREGANRWIHPPLPIAFPALGMRRPCDPRRSAERRTFSFQKHKT